MSISGSVGKGGLNLPTDVIRIQEALNVTRIQDQLPPIEIDGLVGPQTTRAIGDFQRLHLKFADDRIDPHGRTFHELERIVSPVIEARVKNVIVGVMEELNAEMRARGFQLRRTIQDDLDEIELAARALRGTATGVFSHARPAIYYPQRQRRTFRLAVAFAASAAAAAAAEAVLLALLAMIAVLIIIQTAPAMGRALDDLLSKIQVVMSKLIDEIKEAIQGIEDFVRQNSRAAMRCSAELILFRQLSQQILDLLKAPRATDELGRRRFQKQLTELFEKWRSALGVLMACLGLI